jgi:hypothetical protein
MNGRWLPTVHWSPHRADGSDDSHFGQKWNAALPGLIDKLDHFFDDAHLEPGTYTFANQYYPFIKSGELKGGSIPLNSDSDESTRRDALGRKRFSSLRKTLDAAP